MNVEKFWDSRAEEFNTKVYTGNGNKTVAKVFELLDLKNMIDDDSVVLDIGCGPGKYAIRFAKRVKSVTGVDISSNMIAYARENLAKEGLSNASFRKLSWQDLDLKKVQWEKKFDLVFASMCPGINSRETLEKMIQASKKFCFLSGFVERTDSVKDYLLDCMGFNNKHNFNKILSSFNTLWELGYYPEIKYIDTEWENVFTVDKALDFYSLEFGTTNKLTYKQKQEIHNHLKCISKDGIICDKTKAKIAWLYWEI